jgi:hypothetical protein
MSTGIRNRRILKITDMRIAVLSQNRGQGGGGGRGGRPANAPTGGQAYPAAAPGGGGVPSGQILVRIDTNQGISGYGEMYNGGVPIRSYAEEPDPWRESL